MRNFGNRGFKGGDRYQNNNQDRQMHPATCSSCGKDCQVPFRPTGDKPVYCSDCFKQNTGGSSDYRKPNRNFSRSSGRPDNGNQRQLDEINKKLDAIIEALHIDQE